MGARTLLVATFAGNGSELGRTRASARRLHRRRRLQAPGSPRQWCSRNRNPCYPWYAPPPPPMIIVVPEGVDVDARIAGRSASSFERSISTQPNSDGTSGDSTEVQHRRAVAAVSRDAAPREAEELAVGGGESTIDDSTKGDQQISMASRSTRAIGSRRTATGTGG